MPRHCRWSIYSGEFQFVQHYDTIHSKLTSQFEAIACRMERINSMQPPQRHFKLADRFIFITEGILPYKIKYWRGVNFGDWRFLDKSPIFNPPVIFLQRYMHACDICQYFIRQNVFALFCKNLLSPINRLIWYFK